MCLINPWSICNKADIINDFIIEHDIDLLAVTETWLTGTMNDEPIISALLPSGYAIMHAPRGSRGGGVAVVYRQSLEISRVEISHQSFEVLECIVRGPKTLRVCIIYQPRRTTAFLEEFSTYLSSIVTSPGHLVVLGDFNIRVDDPADRYAHQFLSAMSALGIKQHLTKPTHRSGHTLDLLLTPTSNPLGISCDSLDCGFPDHFAVFAEIDMKKPALPKKRITYRKIKSITQASLHAEIASSLLLVQPQEQPLDHLITTYNSELSRIMNKLAPLKTSEITIRPEARWFNDDVRAAKQHRRQTERLWRSTGLVVHRDMFIAEKNRVNALISNAKQQFFKDQIALCGGDQRKLFSIAPTLLGRAVSSPLPSGETKAVANDLSAFFVAKIRMIQASISISSNTATANHQAQTPITSPLADFNPIMQDELTKLLMASPNKQCELDPIPTCVLKLACTELAPFIMTIINCSLLSGVFPDAFKVAHVSPNLKKSSLNPEEFASYRPVSNLSFISKTLERVVAEQLVTHLETNGLSEPLQSAYRRHHSTETALIRIQTDIKDAIVDRKVVLMAMLDLSAAFDTVSHAILLQSLEAAGVQGTALKWMESYIQDRYQVVVVKGEKSSPEKLDTGVAQGSVLGPLLFCVYTRSLGSLLRSHGVNYHLYADDTQIYVTCDETDISNGIRLLEECLCAVQVWMTEHKLKLNTNKTEFLVFASKETARHIHPCVLRVGDDDVKSSCSAKNIGVFMDQSLTCEQQVHHVCRTGYAQLRNLAKVKRFIDRASLETLIHAFITVRIDYCNSLLYGVNDNLIRKLQVLQNACARLITNVSRFDHITPVLIQLHWLPVKDRIAFKILVMTFKCIHGLSPGYLSNLLSHHQSSRPTRSSESLVLHVPFTRSHVLYSTSFTFVAPRLWNELPFSIRSAPSLNAFKSLLKTHLFISRFS